jgi:CO/xanthine dehydrogenase FAD-binding subunit
VGNDLLAEPPRGLSPPAVYASPFEYAVASSWEEAVRLLSQGGEDAKVIAGGQSLVPMMTLRLATPRLLVDVNRASPEQVEQRDGHLVIPALTRHAELERSPVIRRWSPILSEAAGFIGNIRVRHRGTIGGSFAHADPASELPTVVVALQGSVVVLGPNGERVIPASEFFVTHFTTALDPGEVVTGVRVPVIEEGRGSAFVELSRRVGDFALVEAAALVDIDEGGQCSAVRLALGAVGERPFDASDLASPMIGAVPDEGAAAEIAQAASGAVEPSSGIHGSAEYRRRMAATVAKRALRAAARRAGMTERAAR